MNEIEEIKNIIRQHKCQYSRILKQEKNKHLYDYIIINTPLLNDKKYTFNQRIDWIVNGMTEFPRCKNHNCNKVLDDPRYFRGSHFRYPDHCCSSCSSSDEKVVLRSKKTSMNLHGYENYRNTLKAKETFIRNYGVDNNMKSKEGYENYKKSLLQKYGVENQFQREDVKIKSKETKKNKYGDENYSNRKKMIETNKGKNIEQIRESYEKRKLTCLSIYGVDHPMKNKEISLKSFKNNKHRKYLIDGYMFDSRPECCYYIYNRDHDIKIICHPEDMCIKYSVDGDEHIYYPDFYNKDEKRIVEIKGINHFENKDINGKMIHPHNSSRDKEAEAKHQCMLRNNVKILTGKLYDVYIKYVKEKYGNNYLDQFEIKKQNKCK